jgi:Kef-type K+ transport system membrane component KefB
MSDVGQLLAVLAVLLGVAWLAGRAVARLGQPAVVGEIGCGLLLGPLVPAHFGPSLDVIAQVGLTVFLFCVGARLAPSLTGRRVRAALVPALGATVLPLVLGALLALWLAQRHAPTGTWPFVVFAAAAMAVTAFPVLARILTERGMLDTADGQRALSAAALTDAVAWTTLAFLAGSPRAIVVALALLLILFAVVRPVLARWPARPDAVVVVLPFGCAAITDAAGLHPAIGAFLAGVAIGHPASTVEPAGTLLAPLYFVLVGRSIDLSALDPRLVGEIAAVIGVAVVGKAGGAYLGARTAGQPPRDAAVFATLMNTRGVTELVFASVGLSLRVIDTGFYAAVVAMALTTTAMTGPILSRLERGAPT